MLWLAPATPAPLQPGLVPPPVSGRVPRALGRGAHRGRARLRDGRGVEALRVPPLFRFFWTIPQGVIVGVTVGCHEPRARVMAVFRIQTLGRINRATRGGGVKRQLSLRSGSRDEEEGPGSPLGNISYSEIKKFEVHRSEPVHKLRSAKQSLGAEKWTHVPSRIVFIGGQVCGLSISLGGVLVTVNQGIVRDACHVLECPCSWPRGTGLLTHPPGQ